MNCQCLDKVINSFVQPERFWSLPSRKWHAFIALVMRILITLQRLPFAFVAREKRNSLEA